MPRRLTFIQETALDATQGSHRKTGRNPIRPTGVESSFGRLAAASGNQRLQDARLFVELLQMAGEGF